MSDVSGTGSSTTTESIGLQTTQSSKPSLPPSVTPGAGVPSSNQQSDTKRVQSTVSYQHYCCLETSLKPSCKRSTAWRECREYVDYLRCTVIEKELYKLKRGWNDSKSFLDPVGPQRVTLVHLAAFAGEQDILELAVELYANGSTVFTNGTNGESTDPWLATDRFGRCALHYAAFEGHSEVITWLLDKWKSEHPGTPHPQISLEDTWGRTPINDAIGRLKPDVVKLLLQNGATVNGLNKRGIPRFLPLEEDVIRAYRPFFRPTRALKAKEIVDRYLQILRVLLEDGTGVDINAGHPQTGWTLMHHAISLDSETSVEFLIIRGADPNLILATNHRRKLCSPHVSMSTYDYASRIQYERKGLSAFQYAAANGKLEFVRLLIVYGGNLAKLCPDNNHTIIDELRFRLNDQDIVNFLKSYFDSRTQTGDNHVYLDYRVLAPFDEPRKMAVISVLIKSLKREELRTILKHPLLQAYIGRLWSQFSKIFYIVVLLYTFFVIFLSWYTILLVNNNSDSATLRWLMCISAFFLFCSNLLQFLVEPKWNLKQSETWLLFVSLTFAMIVAVIGQVNSNSPWVRHILSLVFPLVGGQMMLFIGHFVLPSLGHYALLISIVLRSVLKVLFIGSFIIAGFSLSFFILFHNNDQFDNPWKAFLKTIVMMTGEYEYGDLFSATATNILTDHNPDSQNEKYDELPFVTGRILLVIFVIITSIVFMNLMIGAAVSDVQALVYEGKFIQILKRAVFINHCEQINRMYRCACSRLYEPVTELPQTGNSGGRRLAYYKVFRIYVNQPRPSWVTEELWMEINRLFEANKFGGPRRENIESDSGKRECSFASVESSLQRQSKEIQQMIRSQRQFHDRMIKSQRQFHDRMIKYQRRCIRKNRFRNLASLKMSIDSEL